MTFKGLFSQVRNFEHNAGFERTSKKQLTKWLKKETKLYEKAKDKATRENKLTDIMILTIQLAIRENISLDKGLKKWWMKSEKYIK